MKTKKQEQGVVIFEGLDGSGKSTLISLTKQALEKKGHKVAIISEVGEHSSVPLGNKASHLKNKFKENYGNYLLEIKTVLKLRKHIYKNITKPLLKKGYIVIYDRHVLSTLVYQFYHLKNFPLSKVWNKSMKKNLTVFVDSSDEAILERNQLREAHFTRNERDPIAPYHVLSDRKKFQSYLHLQNLFFIVNNDKSQIPKNIELIVEYIENNV